MNIRKIAGVAILTALALIIFFVEAQIPPLVPVPGIKMGLANVITLVTLAFFGRKEALAVLMLRIILGSIFAGTFLSLVYSLSGGLLCFIAMNAAALFFKNNTFWVISVFGAIFHNIGQIAAAAVLTSTWQVIAYLPVLILSAIVTGAFTGLLAQAVIQKKDMIFRNKNL